MDSPLPHPGTSEATAVPVARPHSGRFAPLAALVARVNPLLLLSLAGAALLRLYGVNWDQSTHIHPDERFLTMFGTASQIPSSLGQYLDPSTSPLSPANVGCAAGSCPYNFYVYGILPVTVNKIVAVLLHNNTYNAFPLQGRVLSAVSDLLVLLFLYLTVRLLEERRGLPPQIKYIAVFVYAISVLPIQLSHFFTVDAFLNLFMFGSFYFALRHSLKGGWINVILSGLFLGLAAASKTSAIFILPLDAYLVVAPLVRGADGDVEGILDRLWQMRRKVRALGDLVLGALEVLFIFALVTYFTLRLADPYYFQSANLLDPHLNQAFLNNLQLLRGYDTPSFGYPPSVQWVHKAPVIFALVNLAAFGLGLPIFLFGVLGAAIVAVKRPYRELFVVLVWMLIFFLFQSSQFTKTMRYFIFIYPLLAIYTAIGLRALLAGWPGYLKVAVAISLVVWPAAFMSIYAHPLSRVSASDWMYRTLPNNSYILSESWDDALPLQVPNTYGKTFTGASLPVFGADNDPSKWYQFDQMLRRGNYLVLSSNRGWGSMPTVPEWYPRMTAYYHELFAGQPVTVPRYRKVVSKSKDATGHVTKQVRYVPEGDAAFRYRRVAEFTSYPSLRYLGIPIDFPDQWSEEAFTVYDHPEVVIFEHRR